MRTFALLFGLLPLLLALPLAGQDEPASPTEPNVTENSGTEDYITGNEGLTPEQIAEREREIEEMNQAAGEACAVCGGSIIVTIIVGVLLLILNIALLIWVARDAKNRGMDSAVLWMFLVMVTGLIGLVIYLFSRPQGQLAQCPSCGGKRLAASAKCPHCQNP